MSKITRLERNRYSIMTKDLSHCYICGALKNSIHEVFFGRNRTNSMKYGCCVPLCYKHHVGTNGVHHNPKLDKQLKKECQKQFEISYPNEDFISIFHKNYI